MGRRLGSSRWARASAGRALRPPQVLAGGGAFDGSAALEGVLRLVDEGADEDDPLALLARDLRPVVGVGRVGQVLVLLVLLLDGVDEVLRADALLAPGDEPLDGQLLG